MSKLLFLELNEFNKEILENACLHFKNIKKLTSLYQSSTHTEDTYDSDFLEPWVQWVSVHTSTPSNKHKIKHLGDIPHLKGSQIWEKLSERGKTSGVWGAMNASKGSADNCLFFLPDPWTASEIATPDELNKLLTPLRYATKNCLNHSVQELLSHLKGLVSLIRSHSLGFKVLKEIPKLIEYSIRYKGEHFPIIAFTEYLSVLLFNKYRKKYNPDVSILFINTLAHLQHHHWHGFEYAKNERLKIGLSYLDRMLEILFTSMDKEDLFIATNALSQENTNDEKPWILYRQIDQATFLTKVGISFSRVEAHMTHDAHIFFETKEECLKALKILEDARVSDQKLFLVESYIEEPKKLFYRLVFTDRVNEGVLISINEKTFPFFSLFQTIVERTGKHIPDGTIYANCEIFPKDMKNHEIFQQLYAYGDCKKDAHHDH